MDDYSIEKRWKITGEGSDEAEKRKLKEGTNLKLEMKKRFQLAVVLNIAIVFFEMIGLLRSIEEHGIQIFQYFTQDSNILALLISIVFLIGAERNWKRRDYTIPKGIGVGRYIATCCLTITFLIVAFILAPENGLEGYYRMFLRGTSMYQHLLCPVLSFLSYVFLEGREYSLTKRCTYLAILPIGLYVAVMLVLNFALIVVGPYSFLHVYDQAGYMAVIWCALSIGGAYILSYWIWKISRRKM